MFSNHDAIKLEIDNKKITKNFPYVYKFTKIHTNYLRFKQEVMVKFRNFLDSMTVQTLHIKFVRWTSTSGYDRGVRTRLAFLVKTNIKAGLNSNKYLKVLERTKRRQGIAGQEFREKGSTLRYAPHFYSGNWGKPHVLIQFKKKE